MTTISVKKPLRLIAGDLFGRSQQYFAAFEKLCEREDDLQRLAFPRTYLFLHSLELLLKAYLAANDESRHGHPLAALWDACLEKGASFDAYKAGDLFLEFDRQNEYHDVRYPSQVQVRTPAPPLLADFYRGLKDALGPAIDASVSDAEIAFRIKHSTPGVKIVWNAPKKKTNPTNSEK